MSVIESQASLSEIDEYTSGNCHVFAVALHRMTGWPIHLVLDDGDPYWVDPEDEANWIASTVHAFCVDDQNQFWDIKGVRSRDAALKEVTSYWDISSYSSRLLCSEDDLREFVGCWGEEGQEEIDRPLENFDDEDVVVAQKVIERAFDGLLDINPVNAPSV